jgi:hypothetical protein
MPPTCVEKCPLVITICLLLCWLATGASALEWHDTEIGAPPAAGSSHLADGTLRVTGAGTGESRGGEQLHFTSLTHPGGDVEVVARLTDFNGPAHGRAGLMLRTDQSPAATVALLAFCYQDTKDGQHALRWWTREQPAGECDQSAIALRQSPPLWLRLVRLGKNFAVYKSPDGVLWSPMGNTSGGQFAPDGPIQVGVFVAGGKEAATATFDNIRISSPRLAYRTSWVGNTFGANRSDRHVSNGIAALWTAPDGTCYTNSAWDEGGEAVKVYRDGRVVKSFRDGNEAFGNSACGEGSIIGDGLHIFLASNRYLYQTDSLGTSKATKPLYLTIDPLDAKRHVNVISGLAAIGPELFVADSRDDCIRVVHPELKTYYRAGNTTVNLTTQPIDTAGVANAAPALLYQSQRETDYTPYEIPGLTAGATYTVRCHFAEYKEDKPGKRLINIGASGAQAIRGYDVVAAAGGPFKPAVVNLPGAKTDAAGKLTVVFERGAGGNGHIVVCGFEILAPDGTRAFALNCGGPSVDGFGGEVHEVPARRFPFVRPGPMTMDSRGHLWIVQRANDFPAKPETRTAKYPAAVKCYRPDGTFTGRQIVDLVNPTALAYDAANDRLLIAENGPDQNIRSYEKLTTAPAFVRSFGVKGGIYAGAHPGRVYDPDAGGHARFYGLTGIGIDAAGSLYISSGLQGTDLRKFTRDGKLAWMLNSLIFCNTADVDPDSDGAEIYSPYIHMSLDLRQSSPGKEWRFTGYNWDATRYGAPVRVGNSQAIVRRVGPERRLILYTSGQGVVESAKIFRYDGDIAIPCGEVRKGGMELWVDGNGDGKESADELATAPSAGGLSSFAVDARGDIWLALLTASPRPPVLRHFRLLGLNAHGVPRYGTAPGDYEDVPFPAIETPASGWGNGAKVHYDAVEDVMLLIGPAKSRKGDKEDPIQYLARYDRWSTGNRTARWIVILPTPDTDPHFMYEVGRPWGCVFQFQAMDAAGDKIFLASLWGDVHVFDAATGRRAMILCAGPEVSGRCAWEDATMGLRAFRRKNGEYLVFTENSGWGGKNNLYRWTP